MEFSLENPGVWEPFLAGTPPLEKRAGVQLALIGAFRNFVMLLMQGAP